MNTNNRKLKTLIKSCIFVAIAASSINICDARVSIIFGYGPAYTPYPAYYPYNDYYGDYYGPGPGIAYFGYGGGGGHWHHGGGGGYRGGHRR